MSIVGILADQLKSGFISLPEWQSGMRDFVKDEYNTAMILERGGIENVTQSDWGYSGSQIKKQYAALDNFAADIAQDPDKWLTGRLDNRARLYDQSGYSALEDFKRRDMINAGWTQERRRLGVADHCDGEGAVLGCIQIAGMGWREIGTLPKIGESLCRTNCRCSFEYRKDGGDAWIVEG